MNRGTRILISALVSLGAFILYDPHDYGDLFFIVFIVPAIFGGMLILLSLIQSYRERAGMKRTIAGIAGGAAVAVGIVSIILMYFGITSDSTELQMLLTGLVGIGVVAALLWARAHLRNQPKKTGN